MAAPNLSRPSGIYGHTVAMTCGVNDQEVIANSAGSNKILKINVIRLASIAESNTYASAKITKGATSVYLIKDALVLPRSSFVVLDKNEYLYLEEGDSLWIKASASTSIDAMIHYEEIL